MRKYYFQAVTPEGKQISGYVTAATMDAARDQLKSGGLSILTLEEPKDFQPRGSGLTVFEFEAINDLHKTIRGTIEAADKYAAYKKLRMEYQLDVQFLVNKALPPSEKESVKAAGIEKELEARLKVDIKIKAKEEKKKKKGSTGADKKKAEAENMAQIVEANEKERLFIVEKIDSVLSEVVPMLEENSEYIDPNKRREIEERIDLLLRLKHSNSTEHLKSLTKRLLEQISEDEIFLQDANIPPEVLAEIARRKGQFQAVGSKFDKVISKGLVDLQVTLGSIDTTELKNAVAEIRIFKRIIDTFYLCFAVLAGLCFLFLLSQAVLRPFQGAGSGSAFFLSSPMLWYVFGLSLLVLASYSGFYIELIKKWKWADLIAKVGLAFVVLLVYTVQFPVFFFWTV